MESASADAADRRCRFPLLSKPKGKLFFFWKNGRWGRARAASDTCSGCGCYSCAKPHHLNSLCCESRSRLTAIAAVQKLHRIAIFVLYFVVFAGRAAHRNIRPEFIDAAPPLHLCRPRTHRRRQRPCIWPTSRIGNGRQQGHWQGDREDPGLSS